MENNRFSASLALGQSIPLPLAVALGGGHKRQMRQAWRPGLAQGTSGQFDGMHGKSPERLVPCITFSWTRKMAQRRGALGELETPKQGPTCRHIGFHAS